MEDVATSAVIAGMCSVRNGHARGVTGHRRNSFELLGIDLLIDERLKVWLLEVNITPGMAGTSELDVYVKNQVTYDMSNVIRLLDFTPDNPAPCREYARIERVIRRARESGRIQRVLSGAVRPWDAPTFLDYIIVMEFVHEQMRRRRFYRAYPKRKTMQKYAKCFDAFAYEDIVLGDWVKMGKKERFDVLVRNMDMYKEEMERVFPSRGRREDQQCHVA
jgi:hypothetical protein